MSKQNFIFQVMILYSYSNGNPKVIRKKKKGKTFCDVLTSKTKYLFYL